MKVATLSFQRLVFVEKGVGAIRNLPDKVEFSLFGEFVER